MEIDDKKVEQKEEIYKNTMSKYQFEYMNLTSGQYHHHYINQQVQGRNTERIQRIAKELGALTSSLPLCTSSSIFMRTDEDRIDYMTVLITGPTDTPYSGGCFIFDIFFPSEYPNKPPLVNLQTT